MTEMTPTLYDQDFYAWANTQAALLRAGKLDTADIENIAEEIESMGRSEKRELVSRLTVLLQHLLKWQYQPERRGASWQASIRVHRNMIRRHLKANPSLKSMLDEAIADAYLDATIEAAAESSLPEATFPRVCPWLFSQIMDEGFWPGF